MSAPRRRRRPRPDRIKVLFQAYPIVDETEDGA